MSEKNSFSIYLLTEKYKKGNPEDALKNINALFPIKAKNLPTNAKMYYGYSSSGFPDWTKFWGANIKEKNVSVCALVLFPVENRIFVFSYGYGFMYIKQEAIVQDFGLKVSANLINSDSLRSTDTYEFSSAKRGRIQSPNSRGLDFFDIDTDTTILKSITGKTNETFEKQFYYVTGANNIRISTKMSIRELDKFLKKLLDLYSKKSVPTPFADFFEQIKPIQTDTTDYDKKLIEDLSNSNYNAELDFSLPELINFQEYKGLSLSKTRKVENIKENLSKKDLLLFWRKKIEQGQTPEKILKNCRVYLYNTNNDIVNTISLKKCIYYKTDINGEYFYLHDGMWYRFEEKYLYRIDQKVKKIFSNKKYSLPMHKKNEKEGDYNDRIPKNNSNFIMLDRNNVNYGQSKVEPCDLITLFDNKTLLIHVKIGESSVPLGHLFDQGYVSASLLLNDVKTKDKVIGKIEEKGADCPVKVQIIESIRKTDFKVVYAIITDRSEITELPLFAKIALVKTWKNLNKLQIESEVIFIKNVK